MIFGDQHERTDSNSEKESYIENLIWKNCFLLAIVTGVTTLIRDEKSWLHVCMLIIFSAK